jgi:hypothetical protein
MFIHPHELYHLNSEMCRLTFAPFIFRTGNLSIVSFIMESKDVPTMESDDALIEQLCMPAEWTRPIPFMMVPEEEIGKDNEPEPKLLDIMSISDTTYKGTYRYFFPSKYKPSDPRGHQLLTDDLRRAGLSQGVKFARTGGGPSTGVYPLLCKCATYYRTNAAAAMDVATTEVENRYKGAESCQPA